MNLTPHPHDVVRVHPGVMVDGRNLGGVLLTVTVAETSVIDATETTGGKEVHLPVSDVDLVFQFGGIR